MRSAAGFTMGISVAAWDGYGLTRDDVRSLTLEQQGHVARMSLKVFVFV
jgi:hypothetical protein